MLPLPKVCPYQAKSEGWRNEKGAQQMERSVLEKELNRVGVKLNGWLPVLQCEKCRTRWEPFIVPAGSAAPTVRFDYWKCPSRCNDAFDVSDEVKRALPKYMVINDVPGMIFSDDDIPEFERYVRSMEATEIPNRGLTT